jgi:hypothetical protein
MLQFIVSMHMKELYQNMRDKYKNYSFLVQNLEHDTFQFILSKSPSLNL